MGLIRVQHKNKLWKVVFFWITQRLKFGELELVSTVWNESLKGA